MYKFCKLVLHNWGDMHGIVIGTTEIPGPQPFSKPPTVCMVIVSDRHDGQEINYSLIIKMSGI